MSLIRTCQELVVLIPVSSKSCWEISKANSVVSGNLLEMTRSADLVPKCICKREAEQV